MHDNDDFTVDYTFSRRYNRGLLFCAYHFYHNSYTKKSSMGQQVLNTFCDVHFCICCHDEAVQTVSQNSVQNKAFKICKGCKVCKVICIVYDWRLLIWLKYSAFPHISYISGNPSSHNSKLFFICQETPPHIIGNSYYKTVPHIVGSSSSNM